MKFGIINIALIFIILGTGCAQNQVNEPIKATIIGERDIVCSGNNEKARLSYNLGYQAALEEDLEASKLNYKKAIKADPDYCDAMDNLARIYRTEGKYDKAISLYKRSLEISSRNSVALINLAVAYKGNGQISEAIKQYQILLELDPDDPEGYYGLALTYFNEENYEDAIRNMLVAAEIYKNTNSPYLHQAQKILGMSTFKSGDCVRARTYLLSSYAHYEHDLYVNYYLGICHLTKEFYNRSEARKYFDVAKTAGVVVPDSIKGALNGADIIYVNLSRPNKALQDDR